MKTKFGVLITEVIDGEDGNSEIKYLSTRSSAESFLKKCKKISTEYAQYARSGNVLFKYSLYVESED